jgi:hypothetical protein
MAGANDSYPSGSAAHRLRVGTVALRANTEKAASKGVRNRLVSSFGRSLPNVTPDYSLKYEAEGGTRAIGTNDCGEQSVNPTVDLKRDFPICVQADVDLKEHSALTVLVSVRTFRKRVFGAPALSSVIITEINRTVRSLRCLGDLPMELRRPPAKPPKDLPLSVGDLQLLPFYIASIA